jgi:hypothetical protein
MFCLVIENLGRKRCIHRSSEDIYENYQTYDCQQDLDCEGGIWKKEITIFCSRDHNQRIKATVFKDC